MICPELNNVFIIIIAVATRKCDNRKGLHSVLLRKKLVGAGS